jgi:hypothetical protein
MKNLHYLCISFFFFLVFACEEKPELPVFPGKPVTVYFDFQENSHVLGTNEITFKFKYNIIDGNSRETPTEVGVCWSETKPSPTIKDNVKLADDPKNYFNTKEVTVKGLEKNKGYYFDIYLKMNDSVYYGRGTFNSGQFFQLPECKDVAKQIKFTQLNTDYENKGKIDLSGPYLPYQFFINNDKLFYQDNSTATLEYQNQTNEWFLKTYVDKSRSFQNWYSFATFSINNETYYGFERKENGISDKMWKYNSQKNVWDSIPSLPKSELYNRRYAFTTDSSVFFYNADYGGSTSFWEYVVKKNVIRKVDDFEKTEYYLSQNIVHFKNDLYYIIPNYQFSFLLVKYNILTKQLSKDVNIIVQKECLKDFTTGDGTLFTFKNKMYYLLFKVTKPYTQNSIRLNYLYEWDENKNTFQLSHINPFLIQLQKPEFIASNNKLFCIDNKVVYEVTLE